MNNSNSEIENAIKYIDDHIEEKIRIDKLAEMSFYSKKQFRYLFEKQTGKKPKKYVFEKRLEHVASLLSSTELTLTEVAEKCSFPSKYNLARSFKKNYGITTLQFIKECNTTK